MPILLTPLHARYTLPSFVAAILQITLPPEGTGVVENDFALGSKRTSLFGASLKPHGFGFGYESAITPNRCELSFVLPSNGLRLAWCEPPSSLNDDGRLAHAC
jgi:hypothetical protein